MGWQLVSLDGEVTLGVGRKLVDYQDELGAMPAGLGEVQVNGVSGVSQAADAQAGFVQRLVLALQARGVDIRVMNEVLGGHAQALRDAASTLAQTDQQAGDEVQVLQGAAESADVIQASASTTPSTTTGTTTTGTGTGTGAGGPVAGPDLSGWAGDPAPGTPDGS